MLNTKNILSIKITNKKIYILFDFYDLKFLIINLTKNYLKIKKIF